MYLPLVYSLPPAYDDFLFIMLHKHQLVSQAPPQPDWTSGRLDELREFLQARVRDGDYKPVTRQGLFYD